MSFRSRAWLLAALVSLQVVGIGFAAATATASAGQGQTPAAAPVAQQAQPAAAASPAPVPADKALGSGPHKAIMEADPGLPTHTVYRPEKLAELGAARLPIVVWGNGACVNVGNRFRWFLTDIASYGFLAIAIGPIGPSNAEAAPQPAPPRPAGAPAPAPPTAPPATHSSQLVDAMNWAIAENDRAASQYFHRLDTSKIAVMGQSCGGVQAIEASADKRVTTTMVWNSGLLSQPTSMGGGKTMTKDDLKALHAPTAYISGDEQDQAYPNANDDFAKLTAIPVFRAYERGVPHTGTYRDSNGGEFGGVAVAWLNWQLKGDQKASLMFVGPECGLCVNPRWVATKKNMK
jgi:dienelactone hydrolase